MAKTISSLNIVLGATVAPFTRAFASVGNVVTGFTGKINSAAARIVRLTTLAVAVGGMFAFLRGLGGAAMLASDLEQTQVALETMLKSGAAASALIKDLTSFAAETPFQFPEVATSAKQLIAYGSQAGNVRGELTMLGDIASGVGAPLGDLVYLYGTLRTQGKAYARDITQFASRGIPIYDELAKVLGVQKNQIADMVHDGKVGFPAVAKALSNLTAKGGQFANMMEKQSQTMKGLWSTLADNINLAVAGVFTRLVEDFKLRDVMRMAIRSTSSLAAIVERGMKRFIPPVINTFKYLYGNVKELFRRVRYLMTVLGPVAREAAQPFIDLARWIREPLVNALRSLRAETARYAPSLEDLRRITRVVVTVLGTLATAFVAAKVGAVVLAAASYALTVATLVYRVAALATARVIRGALLASMLAYRGTILAVTTLTRVLTTVQAGLRAALVGGAAALALLRAGYAATRAAVVAFLASTTAANIAQRVARAATLALAATQRLLLAAYVATRAVLAPYMAAIGALTILQAAQRVAAMAVAATNWLMHRSLLALNAATIAAIVAARAWVISLGSSRAVLYGIVIVHRLYNATLAAGRTLMVAMTAITYGLVSGQYAMRAAALAVAAARWIQIAAENAWWLITTNMQVLIRTVTLGQIAHRAATLAAAAAMGVWTVATMGGRAIMAGFRAILAAGTIAAVAWRAVTMSVTAAQWLLNVALTANPIGLVIVAIGALVAWLVSAAAGITDFSQIVSGMQYAFQMVSYAVTNWRDTMELAFIEASLFVVRTGNQIAHVFTVVIPDLLRWFSNNWRDVFQTLWNGTTAIFTNMATNIWNFFKQVGSWLAGGGFNFKWTSLLDGFESTLKELPVIAERQIGPLEASMERASAAAREKYVAGFRDALKGIPKAVEAPVIEPAFEFPEPVIPDITVPPVGPVNTRVDVDTSAFGDITTAAKDTKEKLEVLMSSSAKAQSLRFADRTALRLPKAAPMKAATNKNTADTATAKAVEKGHEYSKQTVSVLKAIADELGRPSHVELAEATL